MKRICKDCKNLIESPFATEPHGSLRHCGPGTDGERYECTVCNCRFEFADEAIYMLEGDADEPLKGTDEYVRQA